MSQQKAQLVSPIDTFTPPGIDVTGAGIVTSTSFVGSGGTVTAIADSSNLNVGVITATFYGDGSGLTGVAGAGYVGQTTAAQSGTTTIDLSAGNVIYFTQDTDTTVAFASTESVQELIFIRTKDDTTTARTITWPASIIWNGGTEPTLIDSSDANDVQIFNLTTRDQGVTWYGYEPMKNDPLEPASLFMWGDNYNGELGQNDRTTTGNQHSSPVQIAGTSWEYLSIGGPNDNSVGAIKTDGTLWVWGIDDVGVLGLNTNNISRSSPTQLPGTQWSRVQINRYKTSYFTKTDGTLWTTGDNTCGQLGQNDIEYRSSPTQVPGTWDYESLSANYAHGYCKKTDGSLWAWGYSYHGELAQNDRIWHSSPVQIQGTQWATIKATYGITVATKTDGTLWTWGKTNGNFSNSYNNPSYLSSPTQVPGTNWSTGEFDLGGDRYVVRALKTDGSLWTWGFNSYGQLGQNDIEHRSSPIQIPGTWKAVNVSGSHKNDWVGGLCTKTDGTLWTWGSGDYGRLGLGDTVHRSSPVQIPGTWKDNLCTNLSSGAIKQ